MGYSRCDRTGQSSDRELVSISMAGKAKEWRLKSTEQHKGDRRGWAKPISM